MTIDQNNNTSSPNSYEKMSNEDVQECDRIALYYLKICSEDLTNKKVLHKLHSVYYCETDDTGALIVCKDGNVLFADKDIVSFSQHKSAFEDGLRTSKDMLIKRKEHDNS